MEDLFTTSPLELGKLFEEVLKNFTYKPDWKFKIEFEPAKHYYNLYIRYKTTCSRKGGPRTQQVNSRFGYEEFMYKRGHDGDMEFAFVDMLFEKLREIEVHECREFFEYKKEKIYDPHETPYDGRL